MAKYHMSLILLRYRCINWTWKNFQEKLKFYNATHPLLCLRCPYLNKISLCMLKLNNPTKKVSQAEKGRSCKKNSSGLHKSMLNILKIAGAFDSNLCFTMNTCLGWQSDKILSSVSPHLWDLDSVHRNLTQKSFITYLRQQRVMPKLVRESRRTSRGTSSASWVWHGTH